MLGDFIDFVTGSGKDKREANRNQKSALAAIQGIETPEINYLEQIGQLSPILGTETELGNVVEDPRLREAQLGALASLQETASADGLDAQAKARLNETLTNIDTAERGSREAILANQRARGLGGSGVELAANLANQQGAAMRAQQAGLDMAAMGEQRKAQALRDLSSLSGNIRGQDYAQASNAARAQDAINMFNTQNINKAQEYNLGEAQRISDTNKTQIPQQNYENQFNKNQAMANAYQGQAQNNLASAQQKTGLYGSAIQAGATAAALASDERAKENVQELDVDQFLGDLTGYRYNYKDPEKHGEGPQVGVMAQDVEQEMPQAVSPDSEGVKRIDYNKLGPAILAALAQVNKKVNELGGVMSDE